MFRLNFRFLIAIAIAAFSLFTYFSNTEFNPVTEEKQRISMSVQQEIALGLQATPELAQQYGGLHPDAKAREYVKNVGQKLVQSTVVGETPYKFDFHLLADEKTVNAFALPGGQIFITAALYNQLTSEDQLAGILGHEIGHVVARHGAQQMAKAKLTQGLTGAAVIASYDPDNPASMGSAAVAALIGNLINMRFGREDELESDKLGVKFMSESQYAPESMIEVMHILSKAGGPNRQPEFFSTHPNPENRIQKIREAIENYK
ncbi:MAG: M48 family metalloprotease [Bacteroidota bacterium]|nr:M48 family metalloprotease [Bacteroidota bacterium]